MFSPILRNGVRSRVDRRAKRVDVSEEASRPSWYVFERVHFPDGALHRERQAGFAPYTGHSGLGESMDAWHTGPAGGSAGTYRLVSGGSLVA